jgi:hypothetical protein
VAQAHGSEITLSQHHLLGALAEERELRIGELEETARRRLGERTVPFVFGYRVRIGVR